MHSAPYARSRRDHQVTNSSTTALRLALRLADPDTADALAERLRRELLAAASERFGLPEEMVAALIGPGGAALRAATAVDAEAFLLRAAGTGDPLIARALWEARYRPVAQQRPRRARDVPGLLAAVLEAADPADPRWYDEDGLVPLLQEEATGVELAPALTGPFPELISYALVRLAPHLPLPAVLDAALALVRLAGGAGLTAFVRAVEGSADIDLGHPELLDLLRSAAAAADPESFLSERRPAGEWTDPAALRALLMLRDGNAPAEKPDGLDWELVRREHARLPFGAETHRGRGYQRGNRLLRLISWAGCPQDLVMESSGTRWWRPTA